MVLVCPLEPLPRFSVPAQGRQQWRGASDCELIIIIYGFLSPVYPIEMVPVLLLRSYDGGNQA